MAIVRIRHAPSGPNIGSEAHDSVIKAAHSDTNPPAGLIVHAFGQVDGEWQSIDIWESAAAADQYEKDILPVAQQSYGANHRWPQPNQEYELHSLVRG
ncbi:MAG: hypothetical protein JO352_10615 [Chloroflexi bacterium]|nr:hypothetical protein [Chloroflexota bacterium]MBV9480667.1 hypothetical protein [Acidobacteriota bacterium]MBV9595570.1 hypothetical protein [Chloroflexota bacterium]